MSKVIVIGAGAAGFFFAVNYARLRPDDEVLILEKSPEVLEKLRISGGGRCNITNRISEPSELVKYYPRGHKALLGPFYQFNSAHTREWFEAEGVACKTEADGRVFPQTDDSETVVRALTAAAQNAGVVWHCLHSVDRIEQAEQKWILHGAAGKTWKADAVLLASGNSLRIWNALAALGHKIVEARPSLFTFKIRDARISELAGLSVKQAAIDFIPSEKIAGSRKEVGDILITHWGLSGPAVLRFSAWQARKLAELNYRFSIQINWCGKTIEQLTEIIKQQKKENPKKGLYSNPLFGIPQRLWKNLLKAAEIPEARIWADLPAKESKDLIRQLAESVYQVDGKSTNKDEFVTAGGVDLDEVNFKSMESRKFPGLYFAGEVLDIDGITGGFNFQAAWTTAWIAAQSMAKKMGGI